jgi:hypothetical protein
VPDNPAHLNDFITLVSNTGDNPWTFRLNPYQKHSPKDKGVIHKGVHIFAEPSILYAGPADLQTAAVGNVGRVMARIQLDNTADDYLPLGLHKARRDKFVVWWVRADGNTNDLQTWTSHYYLVDTIPGQTSVQEVADSNIKHLFHYCPPDAGLNSYHTADFDVHDITNKYGNGPCYYMPASAQGQAPQFSNKAAPPPDTGIIVFNGGSSSWVACGGGCCNGG